MSGKFENHQDNEKQRGGSTLLTVLLILLVVAALAAAAYFLLPKFLSTQPTEPSTESTLAVTEAPTTQPTTEPTTAPTTEPPPVYTNPLTGEVIDAPLSKRIFAVSINNLPYAVPHIGTNQADILMEMLVNGSIIRCLALYTDPSDVPAIGSVRSNRFMFNNICLHYDAIMIHAGGDSTVRANARERGIPNYNIDTESDTPYSFRDKERNKAGYGWEHCLFAKGDGLEAHAVEKEIDVNQDPEKDYCLRFTEDGTPEGGEAASTVSLTFHYSKTKKETSMIYNPELGKYVYHQYEEDMVDGATGEPEAFKNVLILLADIKMINRGFYEGDLVTGGQGYYACGGKIIPITWGSDSEESPLWFKTLDGEPLLMGVGNSYFAIAPIDSPVTYE